MDKMEEIPKDTIFMLKNKHHCIIFKRKDAVVPYKDDINLLLHPISIIYISPDVPDKHNSFFIKICERNVSGTYDSDILRGSNCDYLIVEKINIQKTLEHLTILE